MIPLCGYILQGGKQCEQPAISGEANLKKGPLNEGAETVMEDDDEQLPAESEQAEQEAEQDAIKIEAAGEPIPAPNRHEHTSAPAPQKRTPLDLLRHSREIKGRRRGRR